MALSAENDSPAINNPARINPAKIFLIMKDHLANSDSLVRPGASACQESCRGPVRIVLRAACIHSLFSAAEAESVLLAAELESESDFADADFDSLIHFADVDSESPFDSGTADSESLIDSAGGGSDSASESGSLVLRLGTLIFSETFYFA